MIKSKRNGTHKRLNARLKIAEWKKLKLVDATEDLKIEVTEDDIKRGKPHDLGGCAFALACKEKFDSRKVQFMHHRAYLDLPTEYDSSTRTVLRRVERYTLPTATRRFVERFDQGKKVSAGLYLLRAPAVSQRLDTIQKRRKNMKPSGKPHPRKTVKVRASGFIRSGTGVVKSKAA